MLFHHSLQLYKISNLNPKFRILRFFKKEENNKSTNSKALGQIQQLGELVKLVDLHLKIKEK